MDQDPIQLNRQTYDQIASQFAAQIPSMNDQLIKIASRLAEQVVPGARILDAGCGSGRDLGWFIEQGIDALGVDLSNGMLREARRVKGSVLCQMEIRQLAFSSGSFAGVWCNAALLHFPKHEVTKALTEISRVLVPGGRFFLSIQKGTGEGLETSRDGKTVRFFARYEAQEMEQFLRQARFTVIQQEEVEFGRSWIWLETVRPLYP